MNTEKNKIKHMRIIPYLDFILTGGDAGCLKCVSLCVAGVWWWWWWWCEGWVPPSDHSLSDMTDMCARVWCVVASVVMVYIPLSPITLDPSDLLPPAMNG